MANCCEFDIHVKGKKKDILSFVEGLLSEYDPNPELIYHYYLKGTDIPTKCKIGRRIYSIEGCNDLYEDTHSMDEEIVAALWGDCAWSCGGCLIFDDIDDGIIDVREASRRYNLAVQIKSCEPGSGFSEDIYMENGEGYEDSYDYDSVDIEGCESYDDLEDYEQEKISEQQFKEAKENGVDYFVLCDQMDMYGNYLNWDF